MALGTRQVISQRETLRGLQLPLKFSHLREIRGLAYAAGLVCFIETLVFYLDDCQRLYYYAQLLNSVEAGIPTDHKRLISTIILDQDCALLDSILATQYPFLESLETLGFAVAEAYQSVTGFRGDLLESLALGLQCRLVTFDNNRVSEWGPSGVLTLFEYRSSGKRYFIYPRSCEYAQLESIFHRPSVLPLKLSSQKASLPATAHSSYTDGPIYRGPDYHRRFASELGSLQKYYEPAEPEEREHEQYNARPLMILLILVLVLVYYILGSEIGLS